MRLRAKFMDWPSSGHTPQYILHAGSPLRHYFSKQIIEHLINGHDPVAKEEKSLEKTLFQKYGGFSKVSRIVLALYDRILDDDDLGPFFDEIDMSRIVDHQTKFISSLMGGPASYTDDQIQKMHDHLEISAEQFDVLSSILTETLNEFGLDPEDTATIIAAFEKRRPLVTGAPNVN